MSPNWSNRLSILGKVKLSGLVIAFSSLYSTQNLCVPSSNTMGLAYGLLDGRLTGRLFSFSTPPASALYFLQLNTSPYNPMPGYCRTFHQL